MLSSRYTGPGEAAGLGERGFFVEFSSGCYVAFASTIGNATPNDIERAESWPARSIANLKAQPAPCPPSPAVAAQRQPAPRRKLPPWVVALLVEACLVALARRESAE